MLNTVTVIGLGLIGGSVAKAVRSRALARRVVGFAADQHALIRELGLVDHLAASVEEATRDADLLILAAPPSANSELLAICESLVPPHCLITDVGSTKLLIEQAAERLTDGYACRFVPAHPIAGSENSGPSAAAENLFDLARVVLCPHRRSDPAHVLRINEFWQSLGATTEVMSAAEHDRIYAWVSHLPHWTAFALIAALARQSGSEGMLELSGAGLRDTTRIAASDAKLWADIGLSNQHALIPALDQLVREIQELRGHLQQGDRASIEARFQSASAWRRRLSS